MRIALLSNVTVEVLAGMLKGEHELWLSPGFGGWMETALSPSPDMDAFDPEAIFLLLDRSHGTYEESGVRSAVDALERHFKSSIVVVPDLEDLADETGSFYDERMWKLGSMPWSLNGLRAIKGEINRLTGATRGGRKKVLAVDFDNTLWNGVVGEDGLDGIRPNVEMQREIKVLQERGVLLVGLSKNNAADVEPVWSDPRMVLKKEDFVDLRINWNDKATNLTASADALNLGSDSFVFLDDNPAEREQMRALHPEVVVPEWPISVRRIARLYFPRLRLTDEDRNKTAQYQAERARKEYGSGMSVDDYLKGLEIWTDIHPIRDDEIPRVAQLSQKTNQFNVCTHRYSEKVIADFAKSSRYLLLTVHAGDRFGDQGLVAFVLVEKAHVYSARCAGEKCVSLKEGDEATIIDWVMSCRAMNRRIEYDVQVELERMLKSQGCRILHAFYSPTPKNTPVGDLFEKFGFKVVKQDKGVKCYERVLA